MFVFAIVGQHQLITKLFKIIPAVLASAAGINHATDRDDVALPEFLYRIPDLDDATDDFVSRHAWIGRAAPFVTNDMEIGMANPAEQNLNLNIVGRRIPALE